MRLVAFNPFKHLEYARRVTEVSISADTGGIVAEDEHDIPCAIVLFDQWSESSVVAHITVENPLALRKLLPEGFKYIFDTCGKHVIFGFTPANNVKACRFNERLGFRRIGIMPDAVRIGTDVIIYRMLREDCQYLDKVKEVA